jgi:murein DD-endopeptidase MepM/ murein hydrolase activator NlpD
MFKKFYIYLIFLSSFVSIIFSFSNSSYNYYYPITNNYAISSPYGARELYGKYNFHSGIDIPAMVDTPIHSIQSGIIKYIGFDDNGYGNYIVLLHTNSYKSIYGHLSENLLVKVGDNINANQIIAYVGPKILSNSISNGNTTGPHLHLSVYSDSGKSIDPQSLIYKK